MPALFDEPVTVSEQPSAKINLTSPVTVTVELIATLPFTIYQPVSSEVVVESRGEASSVCGFPSASIYDSLLLAAIHLE